MIHHAERCVYCEYVIVKPAIALSVVLIGLLLVAACGAPGNAFSSEVEQGIKPSQPLDVQLSFSTLPLLDKDVDLTFTVMPEIDSEHAEIAVDIPQGFVVIRGSKVWQGKAFKGAAISISLTLRVARQGVWKVSGDAQLHVEGGKFGKADILYVDVGPSSTTVSRESPKTVPIEDRLESVP